MLNLLGIGNYAPAVQAPPAASFHAFPMRNDLMGDPSFTEVDHLREALGRGFGLNIRRGAK